MSHRSGSSSRVLIRLLLCGAALLPYGLTMPAFAQEEEPPLRGALPNGPPLSSEADPSADPASVDPFAGETIPEEQAGSVEEEEETGQKPKNAVEEKLKFPGQAVAVPQEGTARSVRPARRSKGSLVNQTIDRRERAAKAESVTRVRGLEKTPNTAVNQQGEFPAPPGLSTPRTTIEPVRLRQIRKLPYRAASDGASGSATFRVLAANPFEPIGIRLGRLPFSRHSRRVAAMTAIPSAAREAMAVPFSPHRTRSAA